MIALAYAYATAVHEGVTAQATEVETLSFTKAYSMHSEILNEERTFWVSLSTSYDDPMFGPEKYPVIYAVDGISFFFSLAWLVNFMSGWENVNYQIPEAIVVEIPIPERLRDLGTDRVQRFYLSVVDSAGPAEMSAHIDAIHRFGDNLAEFGPENLESELEVFLNTDHSSIPLLNWYCGLQFVFEGYDLSHYGMMYNPERIEPHFDSLAIRTGLRMDPPQTIFHILSHYLSAPNRFPDAEKALYVINMGLKYHPETPILHEKLGAAYEMMDDPVRALDSYETSLRLNPANQALHEKVQQLRR